MPDNVEQSPPINPPAGNGASSPEEVWSYRGYRLRSSEFTTAMVHLFRAEVSRANVWRQRLDATTNWAVVSTGAAISFAFSQTGHHGVIILSTFLITMFLLIEARRYRYYELWSSRIRLMETDFFAAMLVPPFGPSPDWAENLAENLLQPHFPISIWEAIGRRYRRNYIWIFGILMLAWVIKNWLFPQPVTSWRDFIANASMGGIPGEVVFYGGLLFNAFWLALGVLTIQLHEASGEVLPRFTTDIGINLEEVFESGSPRRWLPWFRPARRRRQLLALVVTDQTQPVSQAILAQLKRGVTALPGVGMFTGKEHSVLMCALTVTEVSHLKAVVSEQDPGAFVIVSPVQEILGKGFMPLNNET
ncbi:MAG: DUF2270 domain-containing protein [Anaerolineales bacterium]|nr:DUF2270 domain-containing protein [Anaerolineales bacterium]